MNMLPQQGLPQFSKTGTAFSLDQQKEQARKQGQCFSCGIKTHAVSAFRRNSITNEHVYDGHCIKCDPSEVPVKVYAEWGRRNPLIAAQNITRDSQGVTKRYSTNNTHRRVPSNGVVSSRRTSRSPNRNYRAGDRPPQIPANDLVSGIPANDLVSGIPVNDFVAGIPANDFVASASRQRTPNAPVRKSSGGERSSSILANDSISPATSGGSRSPLRNSSAGERCRAQIPRPDPDFLESDLLSSDSFATGMDESISILQSFPESLGAATVETDSYWESSAPSMIEDNSGHLGDWRVETEKEGQAPPPEAAPGSSALMAEMLATQNYVEWLDDCASKARDSQKRGNKNFDTSGAVLAVVAALRMQTHDPSLQKSGCRALCYLAIGGAGEVVAQGGLSALLSAMSQQIGNVNVQQYGCGALQNISVKAKHHAALVSQGATSAIMAAIRNHSGDTKVQQLGVGTLKNLTLTNDTKSKIATIGAISLIIESSMDRGHASDTKTQLLAIGALKNLAARDDFRKKITEKSGIKAIITAMKEHLNSASIQQEGCAALLNLSMMKENREPIGSDGIPTVIQSMERHKNNPKVVNNACGLLWSLSANKSNKSFISSNNGISVVVECMQGCPEDADAQQSGTLLLGNMATISSCRVSIVQCGGIASAIRGMKRFPDNAQVQKYACRFLANASVDPECKKAIVQHGGRDAAKFALRAHRDNVEKYVKQLGISW